MGRARNQQHRTTDPFGSVLGSRRGNASVSAEDIAAGAAVLDAFCSVPNYVPFEEARVVLEAGDARRGAQALREFTGLLDEDYAREAEMVFEAVRQQRP